MSAAKQCPRFVQNAWKKDLCSNCFKSKEEHAAAVPTIKSIPTKIQKIANVPAKSIIKSSFPLSKKNKKKSVNFPAEISEVIGEGGDWQCGSDDDDDDDDIPDNNGVEELVYNDDEKLQNLTKTNTEFNMNNGNLLGDPTVNIKRSFAALKLGAPQKDASGKKQTLKISVTPFGGTSSASTPSKSKISSNLKTPNENSIEKSKQNGIILTKAASITDGGSNDEVDKSNDFEIKLNATCEKSLLEEINETLLSKKILVNEAAQSNSIAVKKSDEEVPRNDVIKVEIINNDVVTSAVISSSDSITNISNQNSSTSVNVINKRTITRNNAILKDKEKPKIQVSNNLKNSESSESSDLEFGTTSDYYDVVETQNSYENVADGNVAKNNTLKEIRENNLNENAKNKTETEHSRQNVVKESMSDESSNKMSIGKSIKDSAMIKKRAESYDLTDNTFMSSKITSDGLIVTKGHLEDALLTDSSFDSSSDEELSNGRSESDSGIGIKGATSIQINSNGILLNNSNNSSDYEDIQVAYEINKALANNREIPDGRSDPDGSSETSPAPHNSQNIDPRQSFLHSASKPKVPIKPLSVNVVKPFQKRNADIIMQLQQVITNKDKSDDYTNDVKTPKKSRAPEPPPATKNESDAQHLLQSIKNDTFSADEEPLKSFKEFANIKSKFSSKTNTVQLKETRNYPAINPKFRSLNHINKSHENNEKYESYERLQNTTPEPAPRHSLSLSSDSLVDIEKANKKKKFSIKKFLRMGSSSSSSNTNKNDNSMKKDYNSHYADIPTSPSDDPPQVKPRLIIIHPLDINNTGVEVVSKSPNATEKSMQTSISGHKKPPVPPNRSDSTKLEMNKPTRPPPPKSNELRTNIAESAENDQKMVKSSSDTVYANLGEIRNSIAPRKPERTNSMRERELKTLELQRRQPVGESIDIDINYPFDTNNENNHIEACKNEDTIIAKAILKPAATNNDCSSNKKKLPEIENVSTRSKIELFENNALKNESKTISIANKSSPNTAKQTTFFVNSDGLKSSVQKMNMTIDSYLKNKKFISSSDSNLLDNSRSPTPPQQQIVANVSSPLPLINYNNVRNSNHRNSNEIRSSTSYEPINVNVSTPKLHYQRTTDNGLYSPVLTFGNATRSYCGSEIGESEIYSPYSFCGSDAPGLDISQNDFAEGCQLSSRNKTVSRLRLRKGRSVVHTNLEDNYSAVIVANHEALAQVLDQLQQPQTIHPILRPIANCLNLRFEDFVILDSIGLVVGRRVFHQAIWQNSIYTTLVLTSDCNQMVSGSELNQLSGGISGALNPITEFCDLVPNNYLPSMPTAKVQMVQATITVLPKMQVEALETMGQMMKSKIQNNSLFGNLTGSDENVDTISMNEKSPDGSNKVPSNKSDLFDDLLCREVGFIILQLVNGLKNMQAKGIEEMPMNLSNIIMCREMTENKDQQARLCILQGINSDLAREEDEVMGTLCQCALKVIKEVLPETKLTQLLSSLLIQERADTLSKIKSVLEYILWGPSDVPIINECLRESELTLKRWLDLSRATVLHGLVRTKIELTIFDECHLIFLVRSNSKIMLDASQIIAAHYNSN